MHFFERRGLFCSACVTWSWMIAQRNRRPSNQQICLDPDHLYQLCDQMHKNCAFLETCNFLEEWLRMTLANVVSSTLRLVLHLSRVSKISCFGSSSSNAQAKSLRTHILTQECHERLRLLCWLCWILATLPPHATRRFTQPLYGPQPQGPQGHQGHQGPQASSWRCIAPSAPEVVLLGMG